MIMITIDSLILQIPSTVTLKVSLDTLAWKQYIPGLRLKLMVIMVDVEEFMILFSALVSC